MPIFVLVMSSVFDVPKLRAEVSALFDVVEQDSAQVSVVMCAHVTDEKLEEKSVLSVVA